MAHTEDLWKSYYRTMILFQSHHLDDYAFFGTPEVLERFVLLEQEFAQTKTLLYQMDPQSVVVVHMELIMLRKMKILGIILSMSCNLKNLCSRKKRQWIMHDL
ncbi:hypothetical protein ACET3Z_023326 [Daucus carota]